MNQILNQPITNQTPHPTFNPATDEELVRRVLTDILNERPSLIPICQCHLIDPNKMRILLWKNSEPGKPDTYILKIAEQKFVGTPRFDRRGETYWKFRELYESEKDVKSTVAPPASSPPPPSPEEIETNKPMNMYSKEELDRIAKFKERQAKANQLQEQKKSLPNDGRIPADEYLRLAKARMEAEKQNSSAATSPENVSPEINKENAIKSTPNHQ